MQVGNGVMGLRVQAESGADGVFQILLDNNNLGRGGHRKPTGLFRLHTNAPASALPLHVTLRQRLYDGVLVANVSDHVGKAVCSFTAFVNAADIALPVAVVQIQGSAAATPSLEWVWRRPLRPATCRFDWDFPMRRVFLSRNIEGATDAGRAAASGGRRVIVQVRQTLVAQPGIIHAPRPR
jgi:hypothetical protein